MNTSRHAGPSRDEIGADAVEATAIGLRVAEVILVLFGLLLVTPPLFAMAVVVVVPTAVVLAVILVVVPLFVVPTRLVRRVLAHHRDHGSTLFLHRLRLRATADRPVGAAD